MHNGRGDTLIKWCKEREGKMGRTTSERNWHAQEMLTTCKLLCTTFGPRTHGILVHVHSKTMLIAKVRLVLLVVNFIKLHLTAFKCNTQLITKTLCVPAALSNFPFGFAEKPVVMLWFLFTATSLWKDDKKSNHERDFKLKLRRIGCHIHRALAHHVPTLV